MNQILIQEMVSNTSMSGVIFTKDRENMDDFHTFFKENGIKIV